MIRATTNGVLRGYRSNLMQSFVTMNKARDTVLTQRNFTSYAEDPAAAAQSFQLRRSYSRVDSQFNTNTSTMQKFDTAWSSLDSVETALKTAKKSAMAAINDPTGSGRAPLGQDFLQMSENMVQTMNAKYGDSFVFSGADGLTVPFTWEGQGADRVLMYRGIPVDAAADSEELRHLDAMSTEQRYVDIGLGLQENEQGKLIESSAFDDALQGINFLGYGTDEDGDPKNICSIMHRMGTILSNCDKESGAWATEAEGTEFERLAEKLESASAKFKEAHVEMDSRSTFLRNNGEQLKINAFNLNEQIMSVEQVDLADAITSFSWAQYSYNAALKAGNSILSQSLMDYMN